MTRVCGRCGAMESRENPLRMSLVNLAREAREDGYAHAGADYSTQERCVDRDSCRKRARRP